MTGLSPIAFDALLPQKQCGKCGFTDCAAYALALTQGAATNLCEFGGEALAKELANRLQKTYEPPAKPNPESLTMRIRAADCIGCTRCVQVCPVDAVVGAPKARHAILEPLCTGCEVCLAVCPTDCIETLPAPAWDEEKAKLAKKRYLAKSVRERLRHLAREKALAKDTTNRKALLDALLKD
ncbi:MAG TPA: hypothetical protein DCW60_00200 [Sutterella sp.]|nr:hypothetical protein [Sutterella sp.]